MPLPTLSQVHVQSALTDLSIAYRQERPALSDLLFPRVSVSKQSDKYFVWNKGDMWRRTAQKRAPGADFARMGVRLSTDSYSAVQFALEYPIPDEIRANQDAALDLEMMASEILVDQHNLEKDYQWVTDFMTTSAGWGAGTITGGAGAWATPSTATVIADILAGVRTIKRALGSTNRHRIVGVCGTLGETSLLTNTTIVGRIDNVREATVDNLRTALAGILGLNDLIVIDREHNTAKEKATASYSPLVDDDFLLLAVPVSPGLNTPAAGYTFAWDEDGRGDMYVEMWRDEAKKQDVLRSICYFDQKQTGADLGVFYDGAF